MPPVNDRVLNWLYSVLTNEYIDVNRTYNDAAEALGQYPSLSPKTEVYTYENGAPALLLLLGGTIPVQFRGAVYRFPIALWVPHAYPREPPLVYVTPSQDMSVRPGQHVSSDGRVYHPYLSGWAQYWDKSSIADFLQVLRGVFAKEPPVVAKSQGYSSPKPQEQPPPVPPTPEEWRRQQTQGTPSPAPQHQSVPPPPPPKPPKDTSPANGHSFSNGYSSPPQTAGPPVPPLPPQIAAQNQGYGSPRILQPYPPPQAQGPPQQFHPPRPPVHVERDSPVSPISPSGTPGDPPARYSRPPPLPGQQAAPQGSPAPPPTYSAPPPPPPPAQPYQYQPPTFAPPPPQQQQPSQLQFPTPVTSAPAPLPAAPKPPPQPSLDLLTSPLDVTLPSQQDASSLPPAPPIPPNPQKDALLTALSAHLRTLTSQTVSANLAALPALRAQHSALLAAHARLASERQALGSLSATLASNAAVLDGAMREADRVIADTHGRAVPDVDDVLVAPTVAASQLWRLVAEERACGEAVHVLGKALDKGRVGADVFVKQVRAIAREAFLKKVVIRKVARGLGLDEGVLRGAVAGQGEVRGSMVGVGVGDGLPGGAEAADFYSGVR
ncbi:ESCRT-I component [Phyllosticta capitalensis]